jgi:hypothetical protein
MRLFNFCLAILFAAATCAWAQSPAEEPASKTIRTPIDKKLEREILKMEDQLRQATLKCDLTSLDRLLADYFASAYEGSERGTSKKDTLALCRAGTLSYYGIEDERTISVRSEIVVIEGDSKAQQRSGTDNKEESETHVKRLWTKKAGRWLLIAQTLQPLDKEP